jgi:hypothetical protein
VVLIGTGEGRVSNGGNVPLGGHGPARRGPGRAGQGSQRRAQPGHGTHGATAVGRTPEGAPVEEGMGKVVARSVRPEAAVA